jgi:hypothetical protein
MLKSMSHLKIHHLHQAGLSNTAIAVQVGCSVRTVYTVIKGPPPTAEEITAGTMTRTLPQGRPSLVRTLQQLVESWLSVKRDLPVTEILRRLKSEHGYPSALINICRFTNHPYKEPFSGPVAWAPRHEDALQALWSPAQLRRRHQPAQ